jgi:hypothetical protein
VEGELALYHAEGARAAYPDSYAYHSYADPDSDDCVSYAHPNDYAHGRCPVRSGAVVLQHPGAELLRE